MPGNEYRYPFTPYPNSWYRVAFSDELRRGQILPVQYIGQKILLIRGDDGTACALGATCPHLGADLSAGGRIVDGGVQCPFHGWRFDGGGACVQMPHCRRIPKAARLASWPLYEINGMVFIHHHADGAAPRFELPSVAELGAPGWSGYHKLGWRIRMHVQEIAENAVDFGHFDQVHAYLEYPRNTALTVDAHRFCVTLEADRKVLGKIGPTQIEISYHGMGCAVARVWSPQAELIALLTPTPIDEQYLDIRLSIFFKKSNNPFRDMLVSLLLPRDIRRDFAKDIPIWENKAYLPRPLLCGGDGPIMKIRRWAQQFYGEPATRSGCVPLRRGTAG